MRLIVSPAAAKELATLPARDRTALIEKAKAFAADPFGSHLWARPLRGVDDLVRLRQGEWRAICRVSRDRETVTLDRVAHRREVYR
jgi:mRNA interferase RelE/StbE